MKQICLKYVVSILGLAAGISCCPSVSRATADPGNEYLDLDITQLMQITITSVTKQPQKLSDAAAAVFVITQEDIHNSGVTSIPEALRMAPGLQVAQVDANKWAITSRGFSGNFANKLLVMIDGRTVYSPAFSGVYWDVQDTLLDDIDRIEVIRGPGATVWGANAVNGVINIITKKAKDTQGGLVSLAGGNHERFYSGARYGAAVGTSAYGRAYLSYRKRDSFELHESGEDAYDDWESWRTGFRLDGEHAANDSWTLQGDLYSNNEHQTVSPVWLPSYPYMTTQQESFDASGWNILGRWHKELSTTSSWTLQAYYDHTHRDETVIEQKHGTFDLDLQYQIRLGERNNLVTGLEYRHVKAKFDNTFQAGIIPSDRSEDLYSGFLQDEIMMLADALFLTLGTKVEHNAFTGFEVQPSARILWKVKAAHTLWAAVSRAVRTPSEGDQDSRLTMGVIPIPDRPEPVVISFVGNKQFKSEELIAYETGYRWLPMPLLSLDFALFYDDYDDLQSSVPMPPGSFGQYTIANGMQGSTYGLELASDWQPIDWLKLQLVYSYIDFDLDMDGGGIDIDTAESIVGKSPKHQFSLRSDIALNQDLKFNLWLRYVDQLKTFNDNSSPGNAQVDEYVTLDANVSWRPLKNIELMLVGQNLFNSSKMEFVSEFSTPPIEIDRSVYAKLTYSF